MGDIIGQGGESKVNYNNNIQKDFIAKLKERYLFTEDTINSTDEKSRNLRMPENLSGIPTEEDVTEEDVKNMLKTRLHKKISGSEHSEWQSAKYKTMEERIAMDDKGKEDHIKQGMKVKGLNDFEQCALFLLNESNYCYNTWLKITFLNYLSSNKKQWTDSNKKELGKEEIYKQLNFFEELDNYKIDPKGNKLSPEEEERMKAFTEGSGFKGYILPENEYLLRMIFIDNMIKGIELFYHLLVVGPDKLMRGVKQSKIDKQKRKDLLYSAGVDEKLEGYGEDFLEWGKKGIARGQKAGFLTKAGCWIVTKVAVCAFMWAIISNNFAEKVDNFLPEIEHLFQTNFRDYTPRIASDFSETRTEFTKIMLEYSGGITNDKGNIMFGGEIEGVTKVPAENIKSEIKRRNAEHLKEIKKLKEIVHEKHKQTIGIIKALPSPEIVSRETGAIVSLTPEQHTSKKDELLKKLNDRKELADKVLGPQIKKAEDSDEVGDSTISVSYGHINQICGESAWDLVFTDAQDKKTDAISDIESRIIAAMGRDGANIISNRIIASRETTSSEGNKGGLGSLADHAANLFAFFVKSKDGRYLSAPGMGDSLDQAKRRTKLIRKDVRNWEESMEYATDNFIKDVLLHIRNTSYWFWIYFTFMSALEIYAVKSILKFIPGTRESREEEREGEFREGGRLLSRKMLACCRKVRTEEIASTITAWEDRGISGIGDATSLVTHEHSEARRGGVRWVVRGVKYMLIVALFRGLAESLRMALQEPKEPYDFTFNDVMRPKGGYVKGEYNTGDVFKFDTRIPKNKKPTPRYYTPPENEKGEPITTKPLSERETDDDIETIYLDDNLYTDNEQEGSMVAFSYKKMESEDGDSDSEPKYHIVGMSFSDTPLEGQLAHIRKVNDQNMKRSAIAPIGLSRASSDPAADMAVDFIDAPPNIGDWRTLNGISINDGDDEIKGVLEEEQRARKAEIEEGSNNEGESKEPGLKKISEGGRKKMKRKRKKTRRKKQKGGKKKTKNKRKRKRKKTRRKKRKGDRKKTRRKR